MITSVHIAQRGPHKNSNQQLSMIIHLSTTRVLYSYISTCLLHLTFILISIHIHTITQSYIVIPYTKILQRLGAEEVASVPGLPRSVRVLIMRRRQTKPRLQASFLLQSDSSSMELLTFPRYNSISFCKYISFGITELKG